MFFFSTKSEINTVGFAIVCNLLIQYTSANKSLGYEASLYEGSEINTMKESNDDVSKE